MISLKIESEKDRNRPSGVLRKIEQQPERVRLVDPLAENVALNADRLASEGVVVALEHSEFDTLRHRQRLAVDSGRKEVQEFGAADFHPCGGGVDFPAVAADQRIGRFPFPESRFEMGGRLAQPRAPGQQHGRDERKRLADDFVLLHDVDCSFHRFRLIAFIE